MGDRYDVAIIGAGPAGAALAYRLAREGIKVLLLEHSTFETPRAGESLSPAVRPELESLSAWSAFLALNPLQSYGTRSVWGSELPRDHSHLVSPYAQGWHIDRVCFDAFLADHAQAGGCGNCKKPLASLKL